MMKSDALEKRVISTRISRERGAGMPLLDYLVARFTYRDRDGWRERIAAGELRVNNVAAVPERVLADGEVLSYHPGDLPEPPVDLAWRVVYEDEYFRIVEKSGNLPVHPAGPFYRHTLWFELRRTFGNVHLVNRLDRETSGLLLVARHAEAARKLSRTPWRKEYLALVFGSFTEPVEAEGVLLPDAAGAVRKKRRFIPAGAAPPAAGGEFAATRLEPVAVRAGVSLVRALPRTGRLHQIRATLCSLGFPLLGDKLYGPDERIYLKIRDDRIDAADRALLRMPRQALHSAALTFRHPFTGREVHVESPLPEDFRTVWDRAGKTAEEEEVFSENPCAKAEKRDML